MGIMVIVMLGLVPELLCEMMDTKMNSYVRHMGKDESLTSKHFHRYHNKHINLCIYDLRLTPPGHLS